jgi:uncharacterized protein YacL
MLLLFLRAFFVVIIIAVFLVNLTGREITSAKGRFDVMALLWSGLIMVVVTFLIDLLTPKKSLASLAGVFFGLLVGIVVSWALAQVVDMVVDIYRIGLTPAVISALKWMMGICICFLVITIVIRTKDDVRFVIPYVEFTKQTKGARPFVLDTSAIIDGRIADLYKSKLFDSPLIVPRFVLNEIQLISDSADKLKRNRGRRGLDILKEMQTSSYIDLSIDDTAVPDEASLKGVDQKLIPFTKNCGGRLVTTDYNLSKVAAVRDVDVLNINDLANSLKTIALPGENMKVRIIKPGEEPQQGVGYLDDGTMVVVEEARGKIGKDVIISITSSLQTSAGKMIFGKFENYADQ